ncbi:hypothetical protein D3C71_2070830 [compost metagenome]
MTDGRMAAPRLVGHDILGTLGVGVENLFFRVLTFVLPQVDAFDEARRIAIRGQYPSPVLHDCLP